jgi:signal transduction histidine kinase
MMLVGSRAMFLSGHDFRVVLTMLLFAALLSGGFSLLCAAPMAGRIERIRAGTARLAAGEAGPGLPTEGHDELAALARDFNRMAEALEAASRREREAEGARRELVAAVSHDLRTPLASALALLEAVADGVAGDEATEERYLRSARGELQHLGRLVDDLFELAKVDSGVLKLSLEECSLADLVSDTLSGLRSRAEGRGVRLVGEVPREADPVLASPPKLQRVLHNLLGNALRHTPADGTVAVRARRCGDDEVSVEVSDTGEGIAPEDLDRVFERSFRGERSRSRTGVAAGTDAEEDTGAGLGLAIARGLVEAHGGRMTVESRPGEGARFRFTLRRA